MTEFDTLTADELREGDVFLEDGGEEVQHTILTVAKVTSTGDVFLKVNDEDGDPWSILFHESDPAPGYVRRSQWDAKLEADAEEKRRAEEEAAAAAEADSGDLEVEATE